MFVYISTKEQCCYFSYITENVKKNKKKKSKKKDNFEFEPNI